MVRPKFVDLIHISTDELMAGFGISFEVESRRFVSESRHFGLDTALVLEAHGKTCTELKFANLALLSIQRI